MTTETPLGAIETILILDDDPANLQGIADILRSEHYFALATSTGLQAIEIGKTCAPPSLFVSDMDLSYSSGMETALKLVRLYPNLPVLFISGTPMEWWTSRDLSNFKRFLPNRQKGSRAPSGLIHCDHFVVSRLSLTASSNNLLQTRHRRRASFSISLGCSQTGGVCGLSPTA